MTHERTSTLPAPAASSHETPPRHERAALAIAIALTLLALALRFWRLGAWSFDSDETFTLRDSIDPRLDNPRPLMYFLNYFVVQPLHSLDELGLRILPALFGGLGVLVFYLMGRRLIGTRGALFGALLLTLSPLHVYYSQFARYWTLVFFLSAVYPYALYLGIRERRRGALILGIVTCAIAALAHPASVLLLGGLGLWFALTFLGRENLRQLWSQRVVRWGVAFAAIVVMAIAVRFLPMLQRWIDNHSNGPNTEFLLHLPGRPGVIQLSYLLSYVESLTVPLFLAGVLGVYLLWRRDRSLALCLSCVFLFPIVFLVLVSFIAPVSTFYLVPVLPAVFLGAGIFLDRLSDVEWELRPHWLLPAAFTTIVIAAGAPTLASQYRDGRRYDYRSMAQWLGEQLDAEDAIFSDQPKVLEHYLPDTEVEYLQGDPTPLMETFQGMNGKTLWVVSPAPAHAFRTNPKLGSLQGWLYGHCQLRNTVGVSRLDFRQYHLQVFRCSTAPISSMPS